MAKLGNRRAANAVGDFYVDSSCIDCGTCCWIAPESFDAFGGKSRVYSQPGSETLNHRALMALLACPVGAIGTLQLHDLMAVRKAFPERIEVDVYHCGYHSRKSYGAAAYLILRDDGNIMVDTPRFTRSIVSHIEALGGIEYNFLTHADDVAEHHKFSRHFGCRRILHRGDIGNGTRDIEIQPEGDTPLPLENDLMLIPTPGHTRGSCCLLYADRYLFSGDHLWWNAEYRCLSASPTYCWYSWPRQIVSMAQLADFRFSWVLPGHGRRINLEEENMKQALQQCIDSMKGRRVDGTEVPLAQDIGLELGW